MTRHLKSSSPAFVISALAVVLGGVATNPMAQEVDHAHPTAPSTQLIVRSLDGKSTRFTADDIASMQHKSVSVYNSHAKTNETYSGVPLADLLGKVGVPLGENVRGKLFMVGVVAEGTDHYSVLYGLAEIDPTIHAGDVIVADSVNGQKLGKDGVFKMVSTEEKRPARWVRNLSSVSVIEVKP